MQQFFDAVAKVGIPADASRPHSEKDQQKDRSARQPASGGGVVLVVEDEPLLREALCEYLTRNSFDAIGVATATAAYSRILELRDKVRALITDMVIPGGGGWDLAQRTRRVVPDLAVIFVSGVVEEYVVASASLHPLTGFLQKPFELSVLLDILNSLLERRTTETGTLRSERRVEPYERAG